jgi:hypothetical protein
MTPDRSPYECWKVAVERALAVLVERDRLAAIRLRGVLEFDDVTRTFSCKGSPEDMELLAALIRELPEHGVLN